VRRFVVLATAFIFLAGCGGSGVTLAPVTPRGSLISFVSVGVLTTSQLAAAPDAPLLTPFGGAPRCNVAVYRVVYTTVGVHGEAADASAGVFFPQSGCAGPYPLLGFGQGTNEIKLPPINSTIPNEQTLDLALVYGSQGYVTAATDYLGLGLSTYPYHPYLQAQTEASAVVDSMRAARNLAKLVGVPLSGQVMLSGASQGGHTIVATQREIETHEPSEFQLAGDAPVSGPYELLNSVNFVISDKNVGGPSLLTYAITGFQKTYGNLYGSGGPASVFQAPYASTIDSLLPLPTASQAPELSTELPPLVTSLLQPAFLSSLGDPSSPIDLDLTENSLLSGWKPKAPVYLCGARIDPLVTYTNSTDAQTYFTSVGATSSIVDDSAYVPSAFTGNVIHVADCLICEALTRANFLDKLKAASSSRRFAPERAVR
jgi:hypothetical protein